MSSRSRHSSRSPCHRNVPACCLRKTRVAASQCCQSKQPVINSHCNNNNLSAVARCNNIRPPVASCNNIRPPVTNCNNTCPVANFNNVSAVAANHPCEMAVGNCRDQVVNNNTLPQADGGVPPLVDAHAEPKMNQREDCFETWSELEKFKLKHFFEEEMSRKKRAVILEFKCVMEREVIVPLKTQLCEYEQEIKFLKGQLEQKGTTEGNQNDMRGNSAVQSGGTGGKQKLSLVNVEAVTNALNWAQNGDRQLQKIIDNEIRRKSEPMKSLGATRNGGNSGVAELGFDEEAENSSVIEESVKHIEDLLKSAEDLNPDTVAMLGKVKNLATSLISTKNFTEDEVKDLIKTKELAERNEQARVKLLVENEELTEEIRILRMGMKQGPTEVKDLNGKEFPVLPTTPSVAELKEKATEKLQKENEVLTEETQRLREKMNQLSAEVEQLRGIECPIPSDTELKATRTRLEEMEALMGEKTKELDVMEEKLRELEGVAANYHSAEKKAEELQTLHAQLLEEKRRKSLEAKMKGELMAILEKDYAAALEQVDKLRNQLANREGRISELQDEISELKRQNVENNNEIDSLKRELLDKEATLEKLSEQNAKFQEEAAAARKNMEEAVKQKEAADREVEGMKQYCEQVQNEAIRQIKEEQKRSAEACEAIAKRGQCILEYEQKCINVTSKMEEDNEALQEKVRQYEAQMETMMSVERRTQVLHEEMEEFHKRAQDRSKELEELKKYPDACDLGNIECNVSSQLPSPLFSLPSLPTPSLMDAKSKSEIMRGGGGQSVGETDTGIEGEGPESEVREVKSTEVKSVEAERVEVAKVEVEKVEAEIVEEEIVEGEGMEEESGSTDGERAKPDEIMTEEESGAY